MKKTSSLIAIIGYIYLALPILIFFVGWCNTITAIIGSITILASLYFAIKNAPQLWTPKTKKQWFFVLSLFLISLIWVYFSGIGALVYQNPDHMCRNPLFELLVSKSWPVASVQENIILTYYIAFWLPSAVVGKLFNSIQIGYYFQVFWAALGVFLFFYYVIATVKIKNYLPIIIFILFSGMDIIGALILNRTMVIDPTSHLEWWSPAFQFSSMTTQLFWVFNQATAAWLIVIMLAKEKNNKSIGFLYSCLFLHSTLPAIGIFPFILYWCIKNGQNKISTSKLKESFVSIFTFQNIVGSLVVFVVCYAYLSSNIAGGSIKISFSNMLHFLFLFFWVDAAIFLFPLFAIYNKKPIYYLVFGCLVIYPFIYIGSSVDFCMRATIPSLVILYLLVIKAIESKYFAKKFKIAHFILIIGLCIGSFTPLHEFSRTFIMTYLGYKKAESSLGFENFFGWIDDNKFMKYFGKIPAQKKLD